MKELITELNDEAADQAAKVLILFEDIMVVKHWT